jgi:hypothetical protein
MIELPVSPQRVAVHLVENDVDKTRTGVLKSAEDAPPLVES